MTTYLGQQLGNYRLVRSIGSGGFADVYLGEHIYLNTQAAIKILQTRLTQNALQVFLAEARTIANLTHRNIVQVLEFGVEQDTPYLVMTYAPNGTLRQRHPQGSRLTTSEVVSFITQVADALQYAHDRKIIHRDVKPENMLVGQNGDILLSDFGIAVVTHSSRYSSQEVGGTAAYIAPEQLQGKASPASDQYALAVVAYEWLTGERPFNGSFVEICSQHLLTPPPPLREKVPSLSPAVEQVILTALNKDAQQRFPSVQAFANALAQASKENQAWNVPVTYNNVTLSEEQIPTVARPAAPAASPVASLTYPASITPSQPGNTPVFTHPASINPSQPGNTPSLTYPASNQAQSGNVNTPLLMHSGPMSSGQFPPQRVPIQLEEKPGGSKGNKGNKGMLVALIALVLVLIAVASTGGMYFLASKKTPSTGGTTKPTSASSQTGTAIVSTTAPTSTSTASSAATVQPVATVGSGTITENLLLTCGTNCSDPIRVTISTIQVNDADANMVWNVSLEDVSGANMGYGIDTFELLASGTQNQIPATISQSMGTLTNKDPYTIQATFAFVPVQNTTYTLSVRIQENPYMGPDITFEPAQINL